MKKIFFSLIALNFTVSLFSQDAHSRLLQLKSELREELTGNILSWWSEKAVDDNNGGFYGRINVSDIVFAEEDKGGILNARILWTYSAAYRVLKDTAYLRIATRARDYILRHFIDEEYGGVFRAVKFTGEPSDTRKQTYTQSFFIYGLAEYSRATGDKKSLAAAKKIYKNFEKYVHDQEANGYYEVFTREWDRSRDRLIGERTEADEKTMNTSLHLMEAYANLYRVWHTKKVEERLRNMIGLFLDKIIDPKTYHLVNFMDRNWNSTSSIDSYGHDIEASWLLYEAASLVNDPVLLERVREASIRIANAAAEGIMPDGSMIDDRNNATGELKTTRSWWPQVETVVGYVNAYELTKDEKYLNYALDNWKYTREHFIDKKNGGWFTSVNEAGTPGRGDKAGFWVCPYHNGRMCLEIIERVK